MGSDKCNLLKTLTRSYLQERNQGILNAMIALVYYLEEVCQGSIQIGIASAAICWTIHHILPDIALWSIYVKKLDTGVSYLKMGEVSLMQPVKVASKMLYETIIAGSLSILLLTPGLLVACHAQTYLFSLLPMDFQGKKRLLTVYKVITPLPLGCTNGKSITKGLTLWWLTSCQTSLSFSRPSSHKYTWLWVSWATGCPALWCGQISHNLHCKKINKLQCSFTSHHHLLLSHQLIHVCIRQSHSDCAVTLAVADVWVLHVLTLQEKFTSYK